MADVLRISIKGSLPNGEVWSVNPVWALNDFPVTTTPAQVSAVATACAAVTVPTALLFQMSSSTNVNAVRVEARTMGGVLENLAEATKGTPQAGTGTQPHPFQTSWVISLRTLRVGGSGRGRLYWPATSTQLAVGTLRPTTSELNSFCAGAKTYLSGLTTAVKATFDTAVLAVWSRTSSSAENVSSIQVGDVLDVQRRRRDALVEGTVSLAFP